jgi:hypothetical protein
MSAALITPATEAAASHRNGISHHKAAITAAEIQPIGIARLDGQTKPTISVPTKRIGINASKTSMISS